MKNRTSSKKIVSAVVGLVVGSSTLFSVSPAFAAEGLGQQTNPWSYGEVQIAQTGAQTVEAKGACKHLDGDETKTMGVLIEYADNAANTEADYIASNVNFFGGYVSQQGKVTETISVEGVVDENDVVEAKVICKTKTTHKIIFWWHEKKYTVARATLTLK